MGGRLWQQCVAQVTGGATACAEAVLHVPVRDAPAAIRFVHESGQRMRRLDAAHAVRRSDARADGAAGRRSVRLRLWAL